MATLNIDGFYFVRGARSICAATNVPTVGWFVKVVIGQPHNTEIRVPCSPAARESGAINQASDRDSGRRRRSRGADRRAHRPRLHRPDQERRGLQGQAEDRHRSLRSPPALEQLDRRTEPALTRRVFCCPKSNT
jgi:hypothetical protein